MRHEAARVGAGLRWPVVARRYLTVIGDLLATTPDSSVLVALPGAGAGAFALGRRAEMRAVYGRFGALWRAAVLALLTQDVDPTRFLVDGLAVGAGMRGRGIGSALLDALCAEARGRGYDEVCLDVADVNPRARALYERRGFVARGTARIGLLGPLVGFSSATRMVRRLL